MFSQPEVHVFPAWSVCLGWEKAMFSLGKGIVFPRKKYAPAGETAFLRLFPFYLETDEIRSRKKKSCLNSKKKVFLLNFRHYEELVL